MAAVYDVASRPGLAALGRLAAHAAVLAAASLALRWAVSLWVRTSAPS